MFKFPQEVKLDERSTRVMLLIPRYRWLGVVAPVCPISVHRLRFLIRCPPGVAGEEIFSWTFRVWIRWNWKVSMWLYFFCHRMILSKCLESNPGRSNGRKYYYFLQSDLPGLLSRDRHWPPMPPTPNSLLFTQQPDNPSPHFVMLFPWDFFFCFTAPTTLPGT